jgi:hypothetical protein
MLFSTCLADAMLTSAEYEVNNIEVTSYTSSAHALAPADEKNTAKAAQEAIQLRCEVRLHSSYISYDDVVVLLIEAVSYGALDTLLHTYAPFYMIDDAQDARVSDVTMELIDDDSTSSGGKSSTAGVTISLSIIGALIGVAAIWYYWEELSLRRLRK